MKKEKKSGSVQIYSLPNHSWLPANWYPSGSKYDKPELVVRRVGQAVLVRNKTWSAFKEGERFDYSKEFCGENRPNETWKSIDLYITGDAVINILSQRARDGDANAAMELARIATESTAHLNKILKTKPELVRELARVRRAWPVIKQKKAKLSEGEKDLFAAIELGSDDFIENDAQTAKWHFDNAGVVAYGLLTYILRARGDIPSSLNYSSFGKLATKYLKKDFCDDSALDWWNFAKETLLDSYPEPHAIDELKQLVTAKSKRRSPGRIRAAILETLKARFLSFAKNTAYRT